MKDESKDNNTTSKYRPIKCVILVLNLLKEMLASSMYKHLYHQNSLLEDQKGYKKKTR